MEPDGTPREWQHTVPDPGAPVRVDKQRKAQVVHNLKSHWRSVLVVAVAMMTALTLIGARGAFAAAKAAPTFTSAEIANAVVFNEGPAAKYVSSNGRPAIKWNRDLRNVQTGVLNAVATDPSLTEFAAQMQSGDPQLVQQGLQNLGNTVGTFLKANFSTGQVDDVMRSLGVDVAPNVVAQEDLDGPLLFVVVVAIAVFIVFGAQAVMSPSQQLAAEKRVGALAASLKTTS
jgi:hypothetical protein